MLKVGTRIELSGGGGQLPRWARGVQRWSRCTWGNNIKVI